MWARIVGGIVREVIDFDPTGHYHPALVWVPCPDETTPGDIYDGQAFAKYVPSPAEVAAAARAAQDAAEAQAAREYPKLIALKSMSPAELDAWVEANVNNLAAVKDAIKTLAIAVGILARRL